MIELLGLGAVAGVIPVYLGIGAAMLLGKILPRSWEGGLIGVATGVLVYLFFDLMHEAVELSGARDMLSWLGFLGGLGASLVGLVALESSQVFGGRAASRWLSLPYMIAVGMGFHNLGEGLAIGASYANGEWALSMLLVTGFALHNGTEGFGIVGAAGKTPVRWIDVFLLGLLAGGNCGLPHQRRRRDGVRAVSHRDRRPVAGSGVRARGADRDRPAVALARPSRPARRVAHRRGDRSRRVHGDRAR